MPFAAGLRESLQARRNQVPIELVNGESLKHVLNKHLSAVEAASDQGLMTSILLLDADRKRLSHAAAPRLPQAYCASIDGSEIGPRAGSCGTAAYFGRPVYVSDISSDPLWSDYRHIALPHGLRSCWSTPICGPQGDVLGTFAIYRTTVGHPSEDELKAIEMITEHVAEAILMARTVQDLEPLPSSQPSQSKRIKLVVSNDRQIEGRARSARLLRLAEKLRANAQELESLADSKASGQASEDLRKAAELSRKVVEAILLQVRNAGNAGWPD